MSFCRCPCCSSPAAAILCPRSRRGREAAGGQPPRLRRPRRVHLRRRRAVLQRLRRRASASSWTSSSASPSIGSNRSTPRIRSGGPSEEFQSDQVRLLLGIDYGCRTSVVYAPSRSRRIPGRRWRASGNFRAGGDKENYQQGGARTRSKAAWRSASTCWPTPPTASCNAQGPDPEQADAQRGNRSRSSAASSPSSSSSTPAAATPRRGHLANLMEQAAHELNIRVETHPKLIAITDPALFDYPIVFMHGRNAFRFTDAERKALRTICRARAGCCSATPSAAARPLPSRSAARWASSSPRTRWRTSRPTIRSGRTSTAATIFHEVTRRDPQPAAPGQPTKSALRQVPPELKGVRFGEHYGVIFSEFDLSCALEKHDAMECRGYTREDAAKIGLNVICYGSIE